MAPCIEYNLAMPCSIGVDIHIVPDEGLENEIEFPALFPFVFSVRSLLSPPNLKQSE